MTATLSTAEYVTQLESGKLAEQPYHFRAVLDGRMPAEILTPADRDQLMRLFVEHRGWTTRQIAEHTKWSDYTVDRIRDRLFLHPPTSRITL